MTDFGNQGKTFIYPASDTANHDFDWAAKLGDGNGSLGCAIAVWARAIRDEQRIGWIGG